MSLQLADLRGEKIQDDKLRCPLCVSERPRSPNKIFKNKKSITNHLRAGHDLTNSEIFKIRDNIKEFSSGNFVEFCFTRGLIR